MLRLLADSADDVQMHEMSVVERRKYAITCRQDLRARSDFCGVAPARLAWCTGVQRIVAIRFVARRQWAGIMLRLGRAAGAALRCSGAQSRYYSDATKTITATLFPGDGIGPEIAEAVKQVSIPTERSPRTPPMHTRRPLAREHSSSRARMYNNQTICAHAGVPRRWSSHRVG